MNETTLEEMQEYLKEYLCFINKWRNEGSRSWAHVNMEAYLKTIELLLKIEHLKGVK